MSDTTGLRTLVNTLEEVLDEKRSVIAALQAEVDALKEQLAAHGATVREALSNARILKDYYSDGNT